MKVTKEQQIALLRQWNRDKQNLSFLQFRRKILRGSFDCIMIQISCGWLGIEKDGYSHM